MSDMNQFAPIFQIFNQNKEDFSAIYRANSLISDSYQKHTLKFLDKFYEAINDPKTAARDFLYPCDKSGTGNVIIKGLKND